MKEVLQNREGILDLVNSRIKQSELGIQEAFATHFFQGSGSGDLLTPRTSSTNGSSSIEPVAKLIDYTPSGSRSVGNINQSTSTWWRNQSSTSSASTYDGFLREMDHIYNTCALGTGGAPDLVVVDQTTYELLVFAIYQRYRQTQSDNNFPFENTKWKKATIVMDEKTPNISAGTLDTTSTGKGTAFFFNTNFFTFKYMEGRDFSMLKDENGKTFAKPINGDSRVGHIAWMGNVCTSNRRKQGVMGAIARSLS